MKHQLVILGFVSAALAQACGNDNLPPGWTDARRINGFTAVCGSTMAPPGEPAVVTAVPSGKNINVTCEKAVFECLQELEGFVRDNDAQHDVLVQPNGKYPEGNAGCSCYYTLDFSIEAPPGVNQVAVFRRWGVLEEPPTQPVKIATIQVNVP